MPRGVYLRTEEHRNVLRGRAVPEDQLEKMRKPRIDLTGKDFGYWKVLGLGQRINGRIGWDCICECGTRKLIRGADLSGGRSTNCGCHSNEANKKPRGPRSDDAKQKISSALKHHFTTHKQWCAGKKLSPEHIRKVLTRRTPSSLEVKFQAIVDKHNLPYKYVGNGTFSIARYNPDFINTNGRKVAIEVYARFYKRRSFGDIDAWKRDRAKVFREYGWEIEFFDEIEVSEENVLARLCGDSLVAKGKLLPK